MVNSCDSKNSDEALRKQAWDYFAVHAGQRLMTFNFYIVVASVAISAIVSTFQKDYKLPASGIILGLLLVLFSFIFWKIDVRNKMLIKGAEDALKFFEGTSALPDKNGTPHEAKIFRREEYETNRLKQKVTILPWQIFFSYSTTLNTIFIVFSILGVLVAIAAAINAFR